jgi:hypothetical protein
VRTDRIPIPYAEIGQGLIELHREVDAVFKPASAIAADGHAADLVRTRNSDAGAVIAIAVGAAAGVDQPGAGRRRKLEAPEAGAARHGQLHFHAIIEIHSVVGEMGLFVLVLETDAVIGPVRTRRIADVAGHRQNGKILIAGNPASAEVRQAEASNAAMVIPGAPGQRPDFRAPCRTGMPRRAGVSCRVSQVVVRRPIGGADEGIDETNKVVVGAEDAACKAKQPCRDSENHADAHFRCEKRDILYSNGCISHTKNTTDV